MVKVSRHELEKLIHGKLEVRAKRDTRAGSSDEIIPAGSIGYARRGANFSDSLVFWPHSEPKHKGDWRTSVHPNDDLEPTGKRGDKNNFAFRR